MRQTRSTRYFGQTLGAVIFTMGSCFGINSYFNNPKASADAGRQTPSSLERCEPEKRGLDWLNGFVYAAGGAMLFLLSRYARLDARNRIKNDQPSEEDEDERDTL
jgi:hypothetical protein